MKKILLPALFMFSLFLNAQIAQDDQASIIESETKSALKACKALKI